ncbi:cytochrome b/b6 domain-containing protein [Pseudarthrobacter oxydans]|uniref:cytochrome b/b6 domain-containing protein n=1 Tax=Pseudarthrobacter oxydans TaxID=1671 RepID=UPI002AA88467|nr:cytochrome b/b6 domain-containing protein [Pseudarthrobacter oxydans]WPU09515.1 cytochrome b/b6 domain-containing protein [Pseudarthrobacter oxydans]
MAAAIAPTAKTEAQSRADRQKRDEPGIKTSKESNRTSSAPLTDAEATLRRGLPRVDGGDLWPPAGFAPDGKAGLRAKQSPVETASWRDELAASASVEQRVPEPARPLPISGKGARAGARAAAKKSPAPQPKRYGPYTKGQWAGAIVAASAGLLLVTAIIVLFVRWFLSLGFMQDFTSTFPGEYSLPVGSPVGFPAWLQWQHFFNAFLIVLIIRSGLTVRYQKRPPAVWSWRNKGRKISLALWFHQFLDILWLANGAVFVVLLFATGHWVRIIPTSWEVFPNAFTAALSYASLDWPTEHGWVNYNALQQLSYFTIVFIAAPLAAVSGVRMSGVWPKEAKRLSKVYPLELARAIHVPVMVYFILFVLVHVTLVLATGALRNLNHMYGGSDQLNWTGFWIFVASLAVIAGGWIAARPLMLAPIARLFGTVSRS